MADLAVFACLKLKNTQFQFSSRTQLWGWNFQAAPGLAASSSQLSLRRERSKTQLAEETMGQVRICHRPLTS